ncbi:MAG TPA: hypothetical protein IAC82_05030 [Candidatus Merdivicinus intestinigallinarum]|nr:hypothetical protein [Candidatus Merdivicinus intestinigallinarum]
MPTTRHYLHGRRRRRPNGPLILALALLVLLAVLLILWIVFPSRNSREESSLPESSVLSQTESSLPEESSAPAAESSAPAESSEPSLPESAEASIPAESSAETPVSSEAKDTMAAVDESYFDDALFIGDSRTQGFILYSGLANTTSYAGKGLAVNKISTDAVVTENGQDYTVSQALENHSGEFKKVYLMFGVNELGWSYPEKFQESYQQVVQEVKKTQPDATIYVQSILPVSKEKSDSSDIYNMERVNMFNGLLQEMAEEEGVIYLDVASSVMDSEGYLPADASTDGVHLNKEYCQIWLRYLEEHTAE